jgi:GH15 family glucan-1,4-alpha-glucosidase
MRMVRRLTERGLAVAWPLLTGERAHYELAAGRVETQNDSWPRWNPSPTKAV